jgi:N-sulfoglucosamine sulfohydrolase
LPMKCGWGFSSRYWLRGLLAVLLMWGPAQTVRAAAASGPSTGEHPHIVLFIADDHTWQDCGPYGARDVRTPQLDRLAAESLQFDLAFAASPTCTPSRSAIYTGLYPFRNGAHANHSLVKDGLRTLPHYLKELGYRVVLAGKSHIGPRPVFPFEYLENANIMPPGKHHVLWTDLNTAAIEKLFAEHNPNQPLCLLVCSHSPHVFWMDNDGYDPLKVQLPPYLLDTPETRASRCRYYTDVSWMDKQVGDVLQSMARHGYTDRSLFMFTADQGAQWPFSKWNLYDAGIHTPLLVRWPGKTKGGSTTRAMVCLIDLLPTMIEAAGGKPPQAIDGKSFVPVLLGRADRHRDEVFATHTGDKGMNRAPMRCVRTAQYKYIINLAPEIPYTTHISDGEDRVNYWLSWLRLAETDPQAARVIRRHQQRPDEELYDVQADPFELENLALDPAHADVLSTLREKVKLWRLQQGEDLKKAPMPDDARYGQLRYAG